MRQPFPDRFWAKVNKTDDGCWNWTGAVYVNGYGKTSVDKKEQLAHRVAYRLVRGEIPGGLQLDHLCRNRICVNPDHLEAVTRRENILRGTAPSAVHARKTHCPQGHEYTVGNTGIRMRNNLATRYCRACAREKQARRRAAETPEQRAKRLAYFREWALRRAQLSPSEPANARGAEG